MYEVATGATRQFTTGGGIYPVWSPSGEYLYFTVGTDGYRRPADASEEAERLYNRPDQNFVRDVSAGDSVLIVRETTADRGRDLVLWRDGADGGEFEEFLTAEWHEGNAEISPDGRWVAYQSDESDEPRIYVQSFPVITRQYVVSPGLGTEPLWSPDGRSLYYRSGSQFLALDVTTEPAFAVLSDPDLLFEGPNYTTAPGAGGWVQNWDIHPDGKRFIMVRSEAGQEGDSGAALLAEVYLVVNCFEELRERMGGN